LNCCRLGSAAKIESIFLREYIRQKHSVQNRKKGFKLPEDTLIFFYTGAYGPIVHADVESFISIITAVQKIGSHHRYVECLSICTGISHNMRLDVKRSLKQTTNEQEYSTLDAMQSSFKILINSFYGYLGYGKGLFNDYSQAML